MFERFTDEARRVVVAAQEEARLAGAARITPRFVLLSIGTVAGPGRDALRAAGLAHDPLSDAVLAVRDDGEDDDLDAGALSALGIDLDRVKDTVEASFGKGALDARRSRRGRGGHLPFADGCKQALERALRVALRRGDRSIDGRHLLLGILEVGDPAVTAVLERLGVDPDDVRRLAQGDSDAA